MSARCLSVMIESKERGSLLLTPSRARTPKERSEVGEPKELRVGDETGLVKKLWQGETGESSGLERTGYGVTRPATAF